MSLYLQTTERCNMNCIHCGYNCTQFGYDVNPMIFYRTIEIAKKLGRRITFGGGEPTLHPHIIDYVNYAIDNQIKSSIISNGSIKDVFLELYEIFKKQRKQKWPLFHLCISLDKYHNLSMVSKEVMKLADEKKIVIHSEKDEEILPAGVGRALFNFQKTYEGCLCPNPHIKVDGTTYWCACKNTPIIGSIFDKNIEEQLNCVNGCWNNSVVDNHQESFVSKFSIDYSFKEFYGEQIYLEK